MAIIAAAAAIGSDVWYRWDQPAATSALGWYRWACVRHALAQCLDSADGSGAVVSETANGRAVRDAASPDPWRSLAAAWQAWRGWPINGVSAADAVPNAAPPLAYLGRRSPSDHGPDLLVAVAVRRTSDPRVAVRLLVQTVTPVGPDAMPDTWGVRWGWTVLLPTPASRLELLQGRADPSDPGGFVIPYRLDGVPGQLRGRLVDANTATLTPDRGWTGPEDATDTVAGWPSPQGYASQWWQPGVPGCVLAEGSPPVTADRVRADFAESLNLTDSQPDDAGHVQLRPDRHEVLYTANGDSRAQRGTCLVLRAVDARTGQPLRVRRWPGHAQSGEFTADGRYYQVVVRSPGEPDAHWEVVDTDTLATVLSGPGYFHGVHSADGRWWVTVRDATTHIPTTMPDGNWGVRFDGSFSYTVWDAAAARQVAQWHTEPLAPFGPAMRVDHGQLALDHAVNFDTAASHEQRQTDYHDLLTGGLVRSVRYHDHLWAAQPLSDCRLSDGGEVELGPDGVLRLSRPDDGREPLARALPASMVGFDSRLIVSPDERWGVVRSPTYLYVFDLPDARQVTRFPLARSADSRNWYHQPLPAVQFGSDGTTLTALRFGWRQTWTLPPR